MQRSLIFILTDCGHSDLPKISRFRWTAQWLEKCKCTSSSKHQFTRKGSSHTRELPLSISYLRTVSKRLEHTICHYMLNHLNKHRVLTSLNQGLHSGYSCETQLVITAHDLLIWPKQTSWHSNPGLQQSVRYRATQQTSTQIRGILCTRTNTRVDF